MLGNFPDPSLHLLCFKSHVVPEGQQCLPSLQHTASGSGQQPYTPSVISQQVSPSSQKKVPPDEQFTTPLPIC